MTDRTACVKGPVWHLIASAAVLNDLAALLYPDEEQKMISLLIISIGEPPLLNR